MSSNDGPTVGGSLPSTRAAFRRRCLGLLLASTAAVSCFDQYLVVGPGSIVAVFVAPDTTLLRLGQEVQLRAAPLDSTNAFLPHRTTTWTTSAPAVATVDEDGIVTGLAPGSATITADVEGVQGTATVLVDLPPTIGLSNDSVGFAATAGTDVPPDSVSVANTGGFALVGLQAGAVVYDSGAADWLAAVLRADTAPTVLLLSPATAAITTAGVYRATVPVTSTDAANSPFAVEVVLTIRADAPTASAVAAGDAQTAAAGLAVPIAPAVRVTDQYGNGVSGIGVEFAVTGGGGSVTGGTPTTGAEGTAAVGSWILGTGLGAHTLQATFPSTGLAPVAFSVTAVSGAPAQVNVSAGNGQTAVAGDAVTAAPAALVLDQFGNPVGGVTVTFSVVSGGGSVTGPGPQSGANGVATVGSWTLGTTAGANALRAVAAGVPDTALFGATGIAGAPATVVIAAGNGQTATVNQNVAVAPAVLVTDANANPVPSASVTFSPQDGSVTGGAATTGPNGVATAGSWRLGTAAGSQQLTATVAGAGIGGNPAGFSATAAPDDAAALVLVSGSGQSATAGTPVGVAPTVRVADQFGNGVPGVQVTFTVTGGGGAITDSVQTSDGQGLATLGGWTLGGSVGSNTVEARSSGLGGSPQVFTATGISGAARNLVSVSGNAQSDTIGATLAPYVVQVTDVNDNGVQGVPVAFVVTGGGGSITASDTTDVNGVASALRVLGTAVGSQTADAAVGGLNGSPVPFTATATTGQAAAIFVQAGNSQTTTVGTAVATDPAVRVEDRAGNVKAGVQVTFVPTGGGGNGGVTGGTPLTDVNGVATVTAWTLGTTAGTSNNTLTATATGSGISNNPLAFTASGTPAAASLANSLVDATEPITASSGTSVSTVTVTVRDQFGNGRSGDSVTIAVISATGNTLTQPAARTNASGVTTGSWTSTNAAVKTVSATIVGVGTITATDDVTVDPAAANLANTTIGVDDNAIVASNTGSSANTRSAVTVTVVDAFGNPRAGDIVTFTPNDADDFWRLSTASTTATNVDTTDAAGLASRVHFSTQAESKTLTAAITGVVGTKTIGTTVAAAAATTVAVSAGDSQTARVTTAVGSVSFTVTDAFTNPVGSQLVTFSAAGGGSPPASGTTNASGVVTASGWTMGSTGTENGNGTFSNTLTATAGVASVGATGFGIFTWSGDVAAMIGPSASFCSGCHVWNVNPNNIVGVAAANPACGGVSRIVASSAATSLIYQMVSNAGDVAVPPCVGRMPNASGLGNTTSDPELKAIRAWINNGALNN
jgi:adhesin/invasin